MRGRFHREGPKDEGNFVARAHSCARVQRTRATSLRRSLTIMDSLFEILEYSFPILLGLIVLVMSES